MRKPLVAGNWKMNGSRQMTVDLLSALKYEAASAQTELVVFPPYIFLEQTQTLLAESHIAWGAQNVSQHEDGAFTGEISASMLREFGCSYVIVGHSERRQLFGETSEQVVAKFILAGEHEINPILCVGETKEEREQAATFDVIAAQLQPLFAHPQGVTILERAVIAYEPVWAIGTGLTATPEQAQEVHEFIRKEVANLNKNLAEKVRILYGGSVKQNNAQALFAKPDIDGGLIGGASLNAKEFWEIAKLCQ